MRQRDPVLFGVERRRQYQAVDVTIEADAIDRRDFLAMINFSWW